MSGLAFEGQKQPTELERNQPIGRLQRRLHLLKWLVPAGLMLLVIAYQLGPGYWIYATLDYRYHLILEVVIFALFGPALAYVVLSFLERWLEERETSDLQARIVAQAQADAQKSRQLSDEALQLLFSAGTIIATLKSPDGKLSPEIIAQAESAEAALNEAAERIRAHLLS
jgi:hypothetical protein